MPAPSCINKGDRDRLGVKNKSAAHPLAWVPGSPVLGTAQGRQQGSVKQDVPTEAAATTGTAPLPGEDLREARNLTSI